MTEETKKKAAAPKAEKAAKPAAKAAPKAEKAAAAPKAKAAGAKKAKLEAGAAGTVTVTQLVGTIARQADQLATLKGLGLGKRHRTRTLKDSPEVRGMIYKVRHLVKVQA